MKRNCFYILLFLTFGCNVRHNSSSETGSKSVGVHSESGDTIRYALGFTVTPCDGYTKVEVHDPWSEKKLLQRYLLVPRGNALPDAMPAGTVVRVPLQNIVVYAAIHAAVLDELGVIDNVTGVCESRYIKIPAVSNRINAGLIQDLGKSTSPNIEKMIESGTEVVIASPFDNGSYGAVEKTGIPIIECADYMEADPLGRAEWIKFIGLLTGKHERADSLFRETETNYLKIKALAENVTSRPKLMTELKYGSTWYVSGGESYMARIFDDARADYIFRYLPGTGGVPLNFETVLDKAIHADIWLIHYNRDDEMTYQALRSDYAPYDRFDPFRNRRIFGCNTNYSSYYEEVPIHPDYLLAELIAILHPNLLPDHKFRYFTPLKE
jgi:iron complex transport system substrate-binding protein